MEMGKKKRKAQAEALEQHRIKVRGHLEGGERERTVTVKVEVLTYGTAAQAEETKRKVVALVGKRFRVVS